jgi:hypothetical protein
MSIFDGIMGNLEGVAEKLGIPADKLQAVAEAAQSKLGEGADLSGLLQTAQEHGLPVDKLQEMLGGGSLSDLAGKASGLLGGGESGDAGEGEGALDKLGGMVKGLFGKE